MNKEYLVSFRLDEEEMAMLLDLVLGLQARHVSDALRLAIQYEYVRCKNEGLL